jgi:hypothetical protein
MIRVGVSIINLLYLMSDPFNGQRSATRDSTEPLTENCNLMMATTVPLVSVNLLLEGIPREEFTIVINDKIFPTSLVDVVVVSLAVGEQLQVDACARRFAICDPAVDSADFSSLQSLLSGMEVVLQKSHQKSLILLSR